MVFGRKRASRDPFKQMIADRRATEDESPWFMADADGSDDLDIEAGRSARMGDLGSDDDPTEPPAR